MLRTRKPWCLQAEIAGKSIDNPSSLGVAGETGPFLFCIRTRDAKTLPTRGGLYFPVEHGVCAKTDSAGPFLTGMNDRLAPKVIL